MKIDKNDIWAGIRGASFHSLVVLALVTSGCASNEAVDGEPTAESKELQLRLSIDAGGFTRTSSSTTEETLAKEPRIDDVLAMLFSREADGKPGNLWTAKKADRLSGDGGEGVSRRFDVRFSVSGRQDVPSALTVSAVANAGHLEDDVAAMKGQAFSEIRKDTKLWDSEERTEEAPQFSMWGIAGESVQTGVRVQNISMKMLRDMAKVTVKLNTDEDGNVNVTGDTEFRLAHALVYNRRGEVAMMPDLANVGKHDGSGTGSDPYEVKSPTIKQESTVLKKDEGYESALSPIGLKEYSIYVPEQDILMGTGASVDDANAMNRPALIIGGYYGGDTGNLTWYRVDFTSGKDEDGNLLLADVLRNHHYIVNVAAVNGPGEGTPEEAYGTLQTNVDTEVVDWTDHEWDAEFDGGNWIAAQREVTVGAEEGDIASIILRSNVPADSWTFSWDVDEEFEAKVAEDLPDENEENETSTEEQETLGKSTRVLIKALQSLPEGMDKRTGVLTVKVTERLKFVINVIQTRISSDDMHDDWKDDDMNWIFS